MIFNDTVFDEISWYFNTCHNMSRYFGIFHGSGKWQSCIFFPKLTNCVAGEQIWKVVSFLLSASWMQDFAASMFFWLNWLQMQRLHAELSISRSYLDVFNGAFSWAYILCESLIKASLEVYTPVLQSLDRIEINSHCKGLRRFHFWNFCSRLARLLLVFKPILGFQDCRAPRFQDYMVLRFQGCISLGTTPHPRDWNPTG